MNKNSLLTRLAVVVLFAALAVGFVSSQIFYRVTYYQELDNSERAIEQIYQTISPTASIAAFVEDEELAKEVVNGLLSNRIIKAAALHSKTVNFGTINTSSPNLKYFTVNHPFIDNTSIGQVIIQPDIQFIQNKANNVSYDNAIAINVQGLIVTLAVLMVSFFLIVRPLSHLAKSLNTITPGTSTRLSTPSMNNESEIGTLVKDINQLLHKTETQFKQERELRQEIESLEKRFRMLFENSISPIALIEPKGTISLANEAFKTMLINNGLPSKRNFGEFMCELFIDSSEVINESKLSIFDEEFHVGEYQLTNSGTAKDTWVKVLINSVRSDDGKIYYLLTFNDITKRKKELDDLNVQVDIDNLTQLFNRSVAERTVLQFIQLKKKFAFVLVDLNDFKPINDIDGHAAGDAALKHFANALDASLRQSDVAVRWGGDEFVLIIEASEYFQIEQIAEKIQHEVQQGIVFEGKTIKYTFSVGVAFYPQGGKDLTTLYQNADKAMYKAKLNKQDKSKRNVQFYEGDEV
ncbi:diguanylate cyclase domain-containing protein [Aliikangiella sp. IMCC44653]